MEVVVSEMATSDLLDGDKQMCYDTGAAAGVSTVRGDFVWLDESTQAKQSVNIRGPSVGKPGCEGRGPLVYRREVDGVPYGLIDPEGVYASNEMNFRVSSAQLQKARGLRIIGGKFKEPDVLECVRSNRKLDMATVDNISSFCRRHWSSLNLHHVSIFVQGPGHSLDLDYLFSIS